MRNGALLFKRVRPQQLAEPLLQLHKHRRERSGEWDRCLCFTSHSHFPVQPSQVLQSGLEMLFPNTLASKVGSRISTPPGNTLTSLGVQSTA